MFSLTHKIKNYQIGEHEIDQTKKDGVYSGPQVLKILAQLV